MKSITHLNSIPKRLGLQLPNSKSQLNPELELNKQIQLIFLLYVVYNGFNVLFLQATLFLEKIRWELCHGESN